MVNENEDILLSQKLQKCFTSMERVDWGNLFRWM